MPENTVTTPLAPMEPDDVAAAFAYIRAMQAGDIDTACAIADDTGPELHRLLLDVAARVFIPVTAADDHDGEPCAHSFLAAALGRLLLGCERLLWPQRNEPLGPRSLIAV
ncbi:hypothetical protein ACFVJ4_39780 [Streptomyces sp. NPDC127178]|uniref:hypothetical protein n=1 Tax=unclassified Streptomyces TaxID=2593676 RepID=UPI00363250F6